MFTLKSKGETKGHKNEGNIRIFDREKDYSDQTDAYLRKQLDAYYNDKEAYDFSEDDDEEERLAFIKFNYDKDHYQLIHKSEANKMKERTDIN